MMCGLQSLPNWIKPVCYKLWTNYINKYPQFYNGGIISPGQKWCQTILEIEISCSQWKGLNMHSKCLDFFSFMLWVEGGGRIFIKKSFVPTMFPSSSQCVPIRFPMCSPRVFPIAPRYNPICFAQSPPIFTYIGGPNGKAILLSIESSSLGASIVPTFICFLVIGQWNWLIAPKKKGWSCEVPQVLKLFLKMFPIAPQFYAIWFAQIQFSCI